MSGALSTVMPTQNEAWTIPLHVIMWTTLGVGLIMAMVVFMLNC